MSERRRIIKPPTEPSAPITPATSPNGPNSGHAAIADGDSTANPQTIFPQWDAIYNAILQDFVSKKQKLQNDGASAEDLAALSGATQFSEIVSRLVNMQPNWKVRPIDVPRLTTFLREAFFGMGQLTSYMQRDGLEEIICNRFDEMFIVQHGKKIRVQSPFNSDKELVEYLSRLYMPMGRELNRSNPAEDGSLPDGSRIHADIAPVAVRGACFSIRKFNPQPFSMEDYLETDMFNQEFLDSLQYWMNHNMNIVVAGGTASGKCQPVDCQVLTPNGFKAIGDVKIGDKVLDPNGEIQYVTGVFPQGIKPCYQVEFERGTTRSCAEHLWAIRAVDTKDDFDVKTLAEIMQLDEQCEVPSYLDVAFFEKHFAQVDKIHTSVFAANPQVSAEQYEDLKIIDWPEQEWPVQLNKLQIIEKPLPILFANGEPLPLAERSGNKLLKVTRVDSCEMVCISVSGSNSLYITDDYIVTHNTTFLNAIGKALLPRQDRLIIIEDNKELQIETEDYVYLQAAQKGARARSGQGDATSITIRDCLRYSLRLRPDRIIIGELRAHEAYDLLQALNTGHDGSMTTIHANSSRDAVSRLASLAVAADELPIDSIYDLIARTINIILHVSRFRGTPYRKVMEAWQFFHDDEVAEEAQEYYAELKDMGEVKQIRDTLMGIALYSREGDGTLVKRNEILPTVAKFSLRQDFMKRHGKQAFVPGVLDTSASAKATSNGHNSQSIPVETDLPPSFGQTPPSFDLDVPNFSAPQAPPPLTFNPKTDLPPWEQ
jgi:Flp pilus assembly CpaF family ATPase